MGGVANIISGLRVAAMPVLLIVAWSGYAAAFLVGLALCLISDMVDGWLARHYRQTSVLGAKMDSWADLAMYAVLPPAAWWLWPDLVRQEATSVVIALASYTLPVVVGLLKFRRLTSYHTWGAKCSSVLVGAGVVLLLGWRTPWTFRIAIVVLAAAEIEEIAITLTLREWRADVPSIVHAARLRHIGR